MEHKGVQARIIEGTIREDGNWWIRLPLDATSGQNIASFGTFLSTMPCRARKYHGVKVPRAGVEDLDFLTAAKMHR